MAIEKIQPSSVSFQSFGAELVDAKGNVNVKTDAVRQALEFYKKLIASIPLKNVTSRFAMERIKQTTALPIPTATA